MRDHNFTGEDLAQVFSFLNRVAEESDVPGMSKCQLIFFLLHILKKNGGQHFFSSSSPSLSAGLFSWPVGVQYLLHTYATEQTIFASVEHFENLRKSER